MDQVDLQAFITVAQEKSISKASQILHLSQPALTTRLKKLEEQLGVYLLERNWKGVQLTSHGTLFLLRAIKIFQEMNDALSLCSKLKLPYMDHSAEALPMDRHEKIKVGISRPLGFSFFTPILTELNRSFPFLRYNIISELPEYVLDLVSIGEIHIGIIPYMENRSDLYALPIFKEEMLLLGPKDDQQPIHEDLNNVDLLMQKPFILFSPRAPLRKITDQVLIQLLGSMPKDIQEVNDLSVALSMVSGGLGYTIVPNSFIIYSIPSPRTYSLEGNKVQRYAHDTLPYQMVRLGAHFPTRTVHMVYSTSYKFHVPIHDMAETISSHYRSMMDVEEHVR